MSAVRAPAALSSILFALGLVTLLACNQTPIRTPTRSFDRPSDVALACAQLDADSNPALGYFKVVPAPVEYCDPNELAKHSIRLPALGSLDADGKSEFYPFLRAVVVNSARGELALVSISNATIVDARRDTPGFGFLPVGLLPEQVRVSAGGTRALTANVDSCDFGFVDLARLYNSEDVLGRQSLGDGGVQDLGVDVNATSSVHRVMARANGAVLQSRPSWIEFSPESGPGVSANATLCPEGKYFAWATFPGCALLAKIDLCQPDNTDNIVAAYRVERDQLVALDPTMVSCPKECGGARADMGVPASTDLAVADVDMGTDSRLPTSQAFPAPLLFARDANSNAGRLFVGNLTGENIFVLPLDQNGAAGVGRTIALEAGALGVEKMRVSPRTQGGRFIYAFARDASVRVIDADREVECEANPDPRDPRLAQPAETTAQSIFNDATRFGCFPLGDPNTPRRSPVHTTPGIELPSGSLPRDVAFVHIDAPEYVEKVAPPQAGPALLVGDFAWLFASDGRASLVNLFDACPAPNIPRRADDNSPYTRACDPNNYAASVAEVTAESTAYPGQPTPIAYERVAHRLRSLQTRFTKVANEGDSSGTPRLRNAKEPCSYSHAQDAEFPEGTQRLATSGVCGPADVPSLQSVGERYLSFPDLDRVNNEDWTLTWEGALPATNRSVGSLRMGATLVDAGANYCVRGVKAGDKVQLLGCTKDSDCNYLQTCVRDPQAPNNIDTGLCLDRRTKAASEVACKTLLRSVLRYRILSAQQGAEVGNGETTDRLSLGEIYEPEFSTQTHSCSADADCTDVTIGASNIGGQPVTLSTSCLQDADGARRCLRRCGESAPDQERQCGFGYQCARSRFGDERCMRAPYDDALVSTCFAQLQSYEVRAGESFTVTGSGTGFVGSFEPHPTTRECGVLPMSSAFEQLRQSRIPLTAPPCTGLMSVLDTNSGDEPNACLFSTDPAMGNVYHFENLTIAFGLKVPNPEDIPRDFSLKFTVVGGGSPFTISLVTDATAQHIRSAVTAPDGQTVFVVDEGKQSSATGLRGQLMRLSTATQGVDRNFLVR